MDLIKKPTGLGNPIVAAVTAGLVAGLTCAGMLTLGTGSVPSIALGIVGFALVLMMPVISRWKANDQAAQHGDATDRPSAAR